MTGSPRKSTENNGKSKRLNLSSRVIHNCEEYRMESTSKTMSALRTKSNANIASEIPNGIITEIGKQEITAKAEFISQRRGETKVTGGEMPILSDNSLRRGSFPHNKENDDDLLSR